MELIKQLLVITEETKKKAPLRKAAARVYHRDYERTKNKPYRKYHPDDYKKRKRTDTNEALEPQHAMRLSKFLTHHSDHDADRQLRHDLHLLRLITNETRPRETDVSDEDGYKVVRFFYPAKDPKSHGTFDKYKQMFGQPRNRSHNNGNVQAHFHDKLTGANVTLTYNPSQQYFVGSFRLNSHAVSQLGEYYVEQIKNITKFLTEGKMTGNDIFFLLIETPGLGSPYGGAAGADQNNGTADLRKDVTGMTDELLDIRGALANHLRADHHDWTYFVNAPTMENAIVRLREIILRQKIKGTPAAISEVAEQVARVYWVS